MNANAHPISLDFGPNDEIRGSIEIDTWADGHMHGFVHVHAWPTKITSVDARIALKVAVLDGRITLPDELHVGLDLVGSSPRVR